MDEEINWSKFTAFWSMFLIIAGIIIVNFIPNLLTLGQISSTFGIYYLSFVLGINGNKLDVWNYH